MTSSPEGRQEAAVALDAKLDAAQLIRWAHDTLYEINPDNYDHAEVCKLNDASVEVILGLAQYLGERHGKTEEWWRDYRAKHPLAALQAPATPDALPASKEAEAVAQWQVWSDDDFGLAGWVNEDDDMIEYWRSKGRRVRPLYAHPPTDAWVSEETTAKSLSLEQFSAIRDQIVSDCALAVYMALSGTPAYTEARHIAEQAVRAVAATAIPAEDGVPPGMVLVPAKHDGKAGLTHEMCDAFWRGYREANEKHGHFESTNAGYNSMLAAAPKGVEP